MSLIGRSKARAEARLREQVHRSDSAPARASKCGWVLTEVTHGAPYANYHRGWKITGRAPATQSFTHPLTYRNDLTATVTLDTVVTTGRLGFPASQPQTIAQPPAFRVPADGRTWKLRAGTLDRQVTFNVRDRCTHRIPGAGRVVETLKLIERRVPQGIESRAGKRKACHKGHR